LLTPPYADTPNDPGYIKGYVAGVRENGGQYTHAACWVVRSVAEHGEHDRAMRLWEMLTPVAHSRTRAAADRYKVEPFAVAADVYGAPPHVGRGGWTWYTGSSGWMYRVAVESLLGLRVENGDTLVLHPRVPEQWRSWRVSWRSRDGAVTVHLTFENPECGRSVVAVETDGVLLRVAGGISRIPLVAGTHQVRVIMG
jgi:cyclic beta-1,2-glucan synthetase